MGKAAPGSTLQAIILEGKGTARRTRTTTTVGVGAAIAAGVGTAASTRKATAEGTGINAAVGTATKLSADEQRDLDDMASIRNIIRNRKRIKPTSPESKPTRKGKPMARVRPIVCELYPPDGIAPEDVKTWQALRAVRKVYPGASRDVVARAIGRRKDGNTGLRSALMRSAIAPSRH